jgi:hypothetical protein
MFVDIVKDIVKDIVRLDISGHLWIYSILESEVKASVHSLVVLCMVKYMYRQ